MKKIVCTLLLIGGLLPAMLVQAGIIASATRVIFREGDNEKSLMLLNTNDYPIVVQTWVDDGDVNAAPEQSTAPFVSLPAVFSMQPKTMKGLRLIYNQQSLPKDRESVFWINLYEIPPTRPVIPPLQPSVTMAMNTQMKVFYRPKAVVAAEKDAPKPMFTLKKEDNHYVLLCDNPSPVYLSFSRLALRIDQQNYPVQQESDMMTPPFGRKKYRIDGIVQSGSMSSAMVNAAIIDDQGNVVAQQYAVRK
ncbi:molecular chaperone [Serratia fonticola]|uniref:fimbrial biogenesis chaperone n=1 Tax=Serratia fonticola TaxID=47917 RepID=UPI0015C609DA|nr:molecular chaperone [Serratia fonticola]MBC3378762.1 molecular chaperone [Serratia fonticola]NYA37962.1 molecular chaperone [Serratia fonticola]